MTSYLQRTSGVQMRPRYRELVDVDRHWVLWDKRGEEGRHRGPEHVPCALLLIRPHSANVVHALRRQMVIVVVVDVVVVVAQLLIRVCLKN